KYGDLSTSSYVGTDAKKFVLSQKQPTMKFGQLDDDSTDSDVSYTVLHEFGHAIGCVHEHQANPIKWDVDAVIAGCAQRYKWSADTTRNQILNQENFRELTKTDFDNNSIMCYWFPAEWTLDKQSAPVNRVLSDNDKSFINRMYPPRTRNVGKLDIVPGIRTTADNVVPLNSVSVDFQPPYNSPPRVVVGLTHVDEANHANIRVRLDAEKITKDGFTLNMDTWADSILDNAGATWLEFRPEERQFQVGSYNTFEDRGLGVLPDPIQENGNTVRRDISQVDFPKPNTYTADKPPKVLTWLTGLDLGREANWRIRCYAQNITHKGFDLVIETWGDTICHSASASWVAYPADADAVQGGKVSSLDVRSWFPAVPKTKGKVEFEQQGPTSFDKTPKVFIGLSMLDMDSAKKMRVKVYADKISSDGFWWHGDSWDGSQLYSVGADWIAF
ncbi:hypothetical protein Micbo1qcDRAFT_98944, partial [Microdochium bolleyi]